MKILFGGHALAGFFVCSCLQLAFMPVGQAQSLRQLLLMPGKLTERHAEYEDICEECHYDFESSEQYSLCLGCHETIDEDLARKSGFHGINDAISGTACVQCHTDHKGRDFDITGLDKDTFNHDLTNFPMEGKHQSLACDTCHESVAQSHDYRLGRFECRDCHAEQSPHNKRRPFGKDHDGACSSCHDSNGWLNISFDHDSTDFPLKYSHGTGGCRNCHINERYEGIGKECISCHAVDDAHQGRFGQECESCHNEKEWKQALFDHDRDTEFRRQFKHRDVSCLSCHTQALRVRKPPTECIGCHRDDDIHNGYHGDECGSCHTPEHWSLNRFDHASETGFELTGQHREATCSGCHSQQRNNKVAGRACVDCHHLADPHSESLGDNCAQCHITEGWIDNLFSHEVVDFPLIGMHRQLSCEECHIDSDYSEMDGGCDICHQDSDVHRGALGPHCGQCHTPNDWTMWLFDHKRQSGYTLKGAHRDLHCELCHNNDRATSRTCGGCHRDDDVHRGSFGHQCQHCHNDESFSR